MNEAQASQDLKEIRKNILTMVHASGEGHIPSSFSIAELLYVIHANMGAEDVFLLSKGHASAGFYAVLAHFGRIDRKDLETFSRYDSFLGGHPKRFPAKGIHNSSGSLGHGFPMAAGYALAKKIKNEGGKVYCIVGDGETNEGTIWETAMYAEQLGLNNLVCVIDRNNSQTRAMTSVNIPEKFMAFGWEVREVDGHDLESVERGIFKEANSDKPLCVIANTVKGKGIKVMESDFFSWHHKAPNEEELALFIEELST